MTFPEYEYWQILIVDDVTNIEQYLHGIEIFDLKAAAAPGYIDYFHEFKVAALNLYCPETEGVLNFRL